MTSLCRRRAPATADAAGVDQRLTQYGQVVAARGEALRAVEEIEQRPQCGGRAIGWALLERGALRHDVDPEQAAHRLCGPQEGAVGVRLLGQQDAREGVGIDWLTEPERPQQDLEAQLTKRHAEEVHGVALSAATSPRCVRRTGTSGKGNGWRGHGFEYAEGV